MRKRVTLKDIADQAGVSMMTVSLALRDDPSIGAATIHKIKTLADELGYVPNHMAKSLVQGRSKTLAVLVGGSFHDNYHNEFLRGAGQYAVSNGYTMAIGMTEGDSRLERTLIEKFRQVMVDGFLSFHCMDSSNYKKLQSAGVPFVLYTKYFEDLRCDYVVCDDVEGGYRMTKHFLDLGHSRIGYVYHESVAESSEIKNRLIGYKKALAEAGIPEDEHLLIPFDYDLDAARANKFDNQLIQVLRSPNPPTALFVCNDITASSVYSVLKRAGFRIPEDLSVGGYEGVYLGLVLEPELTTVSTPIFDMGMTACKLLIDKIEGRIGIDDVHTISLEPILNIRHSTLRR